MPKERGENLNFWPKRTSRFVEIKIFGDLEEEEEGDNGRILNERTSAVLPSHPPMSAIFPLIANGNGHAC